MQAGIYGCSIKLFNRYLSKEKFLTLDKWLSENSKDAIVFNALKNKDYDIFISFNSTNETIKYEAVLKNTNLELPSYLITEILPTGMPLSSINALYVFIYDIETKLTIDKLKEKYQCIYEKIKHNIKLRYGVCLKSTRL